MTRSVDRIVNFRTPFIFAFMLMWSSYAICGEIHEAVKKNDTAKVKELVTANPDVVFSKDEDGFTPLHLAAKSGYSDMVKYLLTTKAEVDARNSYGSTPLHQVALAKGQHSDIIEMLLMHGARVNAPDKYGLTPLHYSTMRDNPDEVKTLLDHSANPNARDYKVGDTPLILAAANGYKAVVKLLLENGAKVNLADDKGTPLAWAIHTDHFDVADLIRGYGGHE